MKKVWFIGMLGAALLVGPGKMAAEAAFEPSVEAGYNMAVQGLDALDGLDVEVSEETISALTNQASERQIALQVSGRKANALKAAIRVMTDEGQTESYYYNNYFYTASSDGEIKQPMDSSEMWEQINACIYLDMTSNYLKMLSAQTQKDGTILYRFAATADTLDDYAKKLLSWTAKEQGMQVDLLQGTLETDAQGHVQRRTMQMVYTVDAGEEAETFLLQAEAVFLQDGNPVYVNFPDLSVYKERKPEEPVETIQSIEPRTVYVTADVNVRAEGTISAAILGGFAAGSGVTQTGFTSDGWLQVQYNGTTGYIWKDYVSQNKPVITRDGSGTMYATAPVNVRSGYSSDTAILGVLEKGQDIAITGTTDNGWVRVNYYGRTGYVYGDYLSWSEPVADTYVTDGHISGRVVDASLGTLTVQQAGGSIVLFNTVYASMQLKDTIAAGDLVEIDYYGNGSPYTASRVVDDISHENGTSEVSCTAEGIVTFCSDARLELSGMDGIYRTFDISEADMEMPENPKEGQYVMVTWMSRTGGAETRNISAIRVMG